MKTIAIVAAMIGCLLLGALGGRYLFDPAISTGQRAADARQARHDAIEAAMDHENVKGCELYRSALRSGVEFDSSESAILERACAKAAQGIMP